MMELSTDGTCVPSDSRGSVLLRLPIAVGRCTALEHGVGEACSGAALGGTGGSRHVEYAAGAGAIAIDGAGV